MYLFTLQEITFMVFIWETSNAINIKYENLTNFLFFHFKNKLFLQKIRGDLVVLKELIEIFNNIFGRFMLFELLYTASYSLLVFDLIIHNLLNKDYLKMHLLLGSVFVLPFLVSIFYILKKYIFYSSENYEN